MKVQYSKVFLKSTDRVKAVDFHPTDPWILTTLYSGKAEIWNYDTDTLVRSFDVTNVPIRAGKFITRKNWIILGSDDFQIRIYNYNTGEKIHQFEAHPDYVRFIDVHPTRPYVISCSDDMTIKLWNWDLNWKLEQIFEGHQHLIMALKFNPKDPNTFASASLDRTVKVWSLGSPTPNFTLEAHITKGVNYVDYYPLNDKPYLITSSDDLSIKIWDYQTKANVATMEGHLSNVSFAVYHPELPLIISGSEDNTVKIWNANTYKYETTINAGFERVWCVGTKPNSNLTAIGFDAGVVIYKFGNEEPTISMDPTGKLIWAKNSEVFTSIIKNNSVTENMKDGEVIPLQVKDLGTVEIFPTSLKHSPNGRFVAVTGDNEYIIYTALAWRNKAYGSAVEFVWGQDSNNDYAIRELKNIIKVFKNFKLKNTLAMPFDTPIDRIFGLGPLLCVSANGILYFYDGWDTTQFVNTIAVEGGVVDVVWSASSELVAIICTDVAYILRFDQDGCTAALKIEEYDPEEGFVDAFESVGEINESIASGRWIGDVFLYTTQTNRLNYYVGDSIFHVSNFDKTMYLLDYIPRDNRIYLTDKNINIISINLSLPVLEYQTTVLREGVETARQYLTQFTGDNANDAHSTEIMKISKFLQDQGYLEEALSISKDNEQRFNLCMELAKFDEALELAALLDSQLKWNKLGDILLKNFKFKSAISCYEKSKDLDSLFLLYSSFKLSKKLDTLAGLAVEQGKYNLAFNCYWILGNVAKCTELLQASERYAEASILGYKYGLSEPELQDIVEKWNNQLKLNNDSAYNKLEIPSFANTEEVAEEAASSEKPAVSAEDEEPEQPAEQDQEQEQQADA